MHGQHQIAMELSSTTGLKFEHHSTQAHPMRDIEVYTASVGPGRRYIAFCGSTGQWSLFGPDDRTLILAVDVPELGSLLRDYRRTPLAIRARLSYPPRRRWHHCPRARQISPTRSPALPRLRTNTQLAPRREHMNRRYFIIYHAGCMDGLAAACAIYGGLVHNGIASKDDIESYYAVYGRELPYEKLRGCHVYIVDFSVPLEAMLKIAELALGVEWIDHHAGALPLVEGLEALVASPGRDPADVEFHFDTEHSGAYLAWYAVNKYTCVTRPPAVIRYVEDRDLWRHRLPNSREINAALWLRYDVTRVRPEDIWEQFLNLDTELGKLAEEGKLLLKLRDQHVGRQVRQAYRTDLFRGKFPDLNIWAVNTDSDISEVGEAVCREHGADIAVVYNVRKNGDVLCSLRSANGTNCIPIAEAYGGGGHPAAAGCTLMFVPLPAPAPDEVAKPPCPT